MLRSKRVYKELDCLLNYRLSVQRGEDVMDTVHNWNRLTVSMKAAVLSTYRASRRLLPADEWGFDEIMEFWPEDFTYFLMGEFRRLRLAWQFCSDVKKRKPRRDDSPDPDVGATPTKRVNHPRKQSVPARRA